MWGSGRVLPLAAKTRCGQGRPVHQLAARPARRAALIVVSKQYVPSDGFGGISPERKAANALRTMFTFVAVKIILSQLEGSGRGSIGSYNQQQHADLSSFLQSDPIRDGDEWIAKLMKRNSGLALRVMEVRLAYCKEDFEFDQLQRLAKKDMAEANINLMRNAAKASFKVDAAVKDDVSNQPEVPVNGTASPGAPGSTVSREDHHEAGP